MKRESKNKERKVIYHLHRADYLLIALPTALAAVLLIVFPIVWSVIARASDNTTDIGGFNFDGLIIIAGIILFSIYCIGYGFLAFALSVLTRRNITFRILLAGIPALAAVIFCVWLFADSAS